MAEEISEKKTCKPVKTKYESISRRMNTGAKHSKKMTSRQRLEAALNHQPVDRLCVDFGAGGQTGMGVCAVDRLRKAVLGDKTFHVKVIEPYQMLGEIDDTLRHALKLDVVGIQTPNTMFGFPNDGWKPFTMFDGTKVHVPEKFNCTTDGDGGLLMYPQGDTSCPPCAKMPKTGYFFDSIKRQEPIDEKKLDPMDNCREFSLLTDEDIDYYTKRAKYLYEKTDYGIYMTIPGLGFGDIALVPAPWMKKPKGIRDVEEWYISTLTRRDYVFKVFEFQCRIGLKNIERLAETVGDYIQVVFITGTDFGTQRGPFISPDTYRSLYKPFHKMVNDKIHQLTKWKTFIHSCGSVYELIPDFIDAGFDILNPVQSSAANMDPATLKKEFGKDIVFWGGGVDTQKTLPFGTPDEVYNEVRQRIEIFAPDGGFVFNAIHNIQSNVPTKNILAIFRAINDTY